MSMMPASGSCICFRRRRHRRVVVTRNAVTHRQDDRHPSAVQICRHLLPLRMETWESRLCDVAHRRRHHRPLLAHRR